LSTSGNEDSTLLKRLFAGDTLPEGVVPVDEHVMFLQLAIEACRGALELAGDIHLLVDEHTAQNCSGLAGLAQQAKLVHVFGHIPVAWQGFANVSTIAPPAVLAPKDHVLIMTAPSFHMALLGTAGIEGLDRDVLFSGAWTVQGPIVREIVSALFPASSGEISVPDETDAALLTRCAIRLMRLHADELAERQRTTALDKADLFSVLNILKAISARRRAHDVLFVFVQQIASVIRSERCSVVRVWGGANQASVLASHEDASVFDRTIELAKYPELRHALTIQEKVVINDIDNHPLTESVRDELKRAGITAILVIPVVLYDEEVGSLFLRTARRSGAFSAREISFFEIVAEAASNALERAHLFEKIQLANDRLERLAITDGLTGLFNQRHFREKFSEEYARADRYNIPLACVIFDVDHFKKVNDEHGHLVGDQVLRSVAARGLACIRKSDYAARYGGEEFVVLMPQTGVEGAAAQAERLREIVAARPVENVVVTISVGVAVMDRATMTRPDDLLRAADDALYKAKSEGRNRVVVANPVTP